MSAGAVGLLPEELPVEPVGNSALRGARTLLLAPGTRQARSREIAALTRHIELAGVPNFQLPVRRNDVARPLPAEGTRIPLDIRFPLWESGCLRIVTGKRIREFIQREPRSSDVMWRWADAIESSNWRNPGELKATFAAASFVGDLTVFNVGGNKYRIAAFVHFRKQIVYVKRIGTHKEYDKWDL